MSNKDEVHSPEAFGLLRAYLARQGFSQSWIQEHTDNSRTRGENADALKAAMRDIYDD